MRNLAQSFCARSPCSRKLRSWTGLIPSKSPSRRTLLRSGLAATAFFAQPFAARAAKAQSFDAWREHFHARALAKGVSEATWNRAMAHVAPDTSVFKEFASPARVHRSDLAVHQSPRLGLAHHQRQGRAEEERGAVCAHRKGFWGRARHPAGAMGRRVRLRRSPGAAEPYAADLPLAGRARLERAAQKTLLGKRADQRAAHRRSRLGHARGDARLMGRRDGPYPMDAGSLAASRHRL